MQVKVSKLVLTKKFRELVAKAKAKKVSHVLTTVDDHVFITVYSQARPVGRFVFIKSSDGYLLEKRLIIERDYYPYEYAVSVLSKHSKRKKVKKVI